MRRPASIEDLGLLLLPGIPGPRASRTWDCRCYREIRINTGPTNDYPVPQAQLGRFNGRSYELIGNVTGRGAAK